MVEKIDIERAYVDLEEAIKKGDNEKAYQVSERIIKVEPGEKEALKCKIVSMINIGNKIDDVVGIIESGNFQKELLLEYAYALHEKKRYHDSISVLNQYASSRTDIAHSVHELLAQNFHKLGKFKESYRIYKDLVLSKLNSGKQDPDLEEDKDLITNYLASYSFSHAQDEEFLNLLTKYLNWWEAYYNYSIIRLKEGKVTECIEMIHRMKKEYPKLDDEYNEFKHSHLNFYILQLKLEGFDINKVTNICEQYESFFNKSSRYSDLVPYFSNNLLHFKKDRDSPNETIKKIELSLKSDSFNDEEKLVLAKNKIILLLRANKIQEALDVLNSIKSSNSHIFTDPIFVIIHSYITFKLEKLEKLEDMIKIDNDILNRPEPYLVVIQLMLSTLTSKTIEQVHLKVLNFISTFPDFAINYHFLNFFIGFYESRHMKDYLKEFLRNFKDPKLFERNLNLLNRTFLKKTILLLAHAFDYTNLYEDSSRFYSYCIENFDKNDKDLKINLIQSFAHVDCEHSEELRRQVDDTMIDLSPDHISSLLGEVFVKGKRNIQQGKKKKKKNKKIKYPKNFDIKHPGPLPDPERWLPKLQRKKYRNIAKNKLAYQGAAADTQTTTGKFK